MIDIKKLLVKIVDYLNRLTPTFGSNTNGQWVKFPEGTMICWGGASVTSSSSGGKFGYYGSATTSFPQTFYSPPHCVTNVLKSAGYWNCTASSMTVSQVTLTIGGDQNASNYVYYIAIGRWKSGGGITESYIMSTTAHLIERGWAVC